MQRVLVLFEQGYSRSPPDLALRFARGVELGGIDVRLRSLDSATVQDVIWAQALALALPPARGRDMPWSVKRWMDALGFVGWASFAGKSGCIFGSDRRTSVRDEQAYRLVARLLVCRGMALCAVDADGARSAADGVDVDSADRAAARGWRLARRLVQYRLGHLAVPRSGSNARLRAEAVALVESNASTTMEPDSVVACMPIRATG